MYPHRIRLRGPWEVEPVARMVRGADGHVEMLERPVPPRFRMTMPGRWEDGGLTDFAGRVRCRRRFGYPGRIDAHERVWLTFAGVAGRAEVVLNDRCLGRRDGAEGPFEFEITNLLGVRNELVVQVDMPEGSGGLWGEVALEVRCSAFLRNVRAAIAAEPTVSLHVAGEVVGVSERPLELYVLFDGATVHYAVTEPLADGLPFQVTVGGLGQEPFRPRLDVPGDGHVVRVDLVNGATIWCAVELVVALGLPGNPPEPP